MSFFSALLSQRSLALDATISKLSVKYNSVDFAYPSSFSWSDLGTVRAGCRMIEGCTITPNIVSAQTNFNTGLAYDVATDRFISKNYIPKTSEFFTRAAVKAACASAIGTIPTIDLSVIGTNNQGIAHDPINSIIFEYNGTAGSTYVREYDYSGNLLVQVNTDLGGGFIPGTIWYDYDSKIMYFTTGGVTNNPVTGLKKNLAGTLWETVDVKWYITKEGIGGINGTTIVNIIGSSGGSGSLVRVQGIEGFPVKMVPTPSSFVNYEEGMVIDPRDLTIWFNEDAGGHASIVDGNRLLHVDPHGQYLKYHRYPNMFSWSDCKLNGNYVTGNFYIDEALSGSNFTILPVVDYGANTGQQTLANWEVGDDEGAELEFRGSATAPTTTPLSSKDYHTLVEYDPNSTNDGWGSTIPGAWQLTPTTDRYMQVRVKPISPTPLWTPADLGSDLIAWFEHNSTDGLYYDLTDLDRCEVSINYADPTKNLFVSTAAQKPIWNEAGTYLDMTAGNRNYQLSADLVTQLLALSECEVHGVARKEANTSRVIFLSVTESSTANNQIVLQWHPSNLAPNNFLSIRHRDSGGTESLYGVTDVTVTDWRMYSFRLGGSANKIYINNVEQTLTVNSGSNTGQCFDDIAAGGANFGRVARITASSSTAAAQRQRGLIITRHLSDANRLLLMDYMQRISMID